MIGHVGYSSAIRIGRPSGVGLYMFQAYSTDASRPVADPHEQGPGRHAVPLPKTMSALGQKRTRDKRARTSALCHERTLRLHNQRRA
jgi:hypothetical protein